MLILVGVEEFCDATKLSPREAELLAREIILDCGRIARLSNLQKSEIDNVTRDDKHYPEPINKAARILSLISEKPEFSRKRLAEDLGKVGYVDLVDKVLKGTLRVSAGLDLSACRQVLQAIKLLKNYDKATIKGNK